VIINAAAYTAVDKAEEDDILAHCINAYAVEVMSEEAKKLNGWLVHYSTDYVFDGSKQGRYSEDDPTAPLNIYGKTKLAGEQKIQSMGGKYLIFRTTWVYAARGHNFAKIMLRLAKERDTLRVISDQQGVPTSAELIADMTALSLYRVRVDPVFASTASGIYHLTAKGETNWHEYACFVLEQAMHQGVVLKTTLDQVKPIPTSEYPTPAPRPLNSCLDTHKLCCTFDVVLPDWKYHVSRMVKETITL
jgi:dTDP-4-dehydrorhamnose reductase